MIDSAINVKLVLLGSLKAGLQLFVLASIFLFSSVTFSEKLLISENTQRFTNAQALLEQSSQLEAKAKDSLLTANKTRQLISNKRVQGRKEPNEVNKKVFEQQANSLEKKLESQQQEEATQRSQALEKKNQAMNLFTQGLASKWSNWIKNTQPLTMDREALDYISHNAVVRSVHPAMLKNAELKSENLNKTKNNVEEMGNDLADSKTSREKMSLRIASLVGQSAPTDLDISAFQLSNDQNYLGHIEVHNSTDFQQNNVSQIPLNQMHQWRLLIFDLNGNPVSGKNIEVLGHMPGHVHGLPTQPQVTQELDKGVYLVEGVKFQMQGWWVIQFDLADPNYESPNTSNEKLIKTSFTFNLIL
jgi:hypothetical protein